MAKGVENFIQRKGLRKRFDSKGRQIVWNWEKSPDNPEKIRYHFIVVDDKDREGKLRRILETFNPSGVVNYPFEEIRRFEGKFEGTDFRYLFISYDTDYSRNLLNLSKVSKNHKQDFNLRERIRGNIEDYVAEKYSYKKNFK